jgi:hypothetical protein
MSCNTQTKNSLDFGLLTPNKGYKYVLVTMTITNNGYDSFSTDSAWFSAVANNITYNPDFTTYSDENWTNVQINNGGTYGGTMVFQIPSGQSISSLSYSGTSDIMNNQTFEFEPYNIVWSYQPVATASTLPSPTIPEFSSLLAILGVFMVAVSITVLVTVRKSQTRSK